MFFLLLATFKLVSLARLAGVSIFVPFHHRKLAGPQETSLWTIESGKWHIYFWQIDQICCEEIGTKLFAFLWLFGFCLDCCAI